MSSRPLHVALIVVLVAGAARCKTDSIQRPIHLDPVDTGPGTLQAAREYLKGRWALISLEFFPVGAPRIDAKASGTMVFDDYANMSVELRLDAATTALVQQMGIAVSNGVISTNGRTVIDMTQHAISYVLEGQAAFRQPMGPLDTNRPRYWDVSGQTLTLRTKDDQGTVLSMTVWRKIS